jgi:hypothetical protein
MKANYYSKPISKSEAHKIAKKEWSSAENVFKWWMGEVVNQLSFFDNIFEEENQ